MYASELRLLLRYRVWGQAEHLRMLCEDENAVFMYSRGCGKTLLKRAYTLMKVLDKLEEENEER